MKKGGTSRTCRQYIIRQCPGTVGAPAGSGWCASLERRSALQTPLYTLEPPAQNLSRRRALIMQMPRYRLPALTLQEPHDADQPHSRIWYLQYPRHQVESSLLHLLQVLSEQSAAGRLKLNADQRAQPLRFRLKQSSLSQVTLRHKPRSRAMSAASSRSFFFLLSTPLTSTGKHISSTRL